MSKKLILDIDLICDLYYNQGLSLKKIGEKLNCSRESIRRCLNEFGRKPHWTFKVDKPYENYFSEITKPEQAWILGWIVSDGHISKRDNTIKFELGIQDINVLKRISQEFEKTKVRKYKYDVEVCNLNFGGKILVNDLVNLGIPRGKKSDIVKPLNLPEELMSHFWRGVWEGDGSIGNWDNKGYLTPDINLTGNEQICKNFRDEVLKISNNKIRKYKQKKNSFGITKQSRKLNFWQDLYNYFYDDYTLENKLYLGRKHDKFIEIIDFLRYRNNT
jgi:AraC-like DNA-binding protein